MTRTRRCLAPALIATIALLGSCRAPGTAQQATMPTSPTPAPTRVSVSTKCFGPFQPGQYVPLACAVFVEDRSVAVSADLRIFGGKSDASGFPACPACGGPPWTVDLDLHVPADMTPGVKTFAVWVTDREGHRADTTASIEIAAR